MLTPQEITAASNELDSTKIALVTNAIRRSRLYIKNPAIFSDLDVKLAAANNTAQGSHINATYDKLTSIVSVGAVDVKLDSDGVDYAQRREIEYWLGYMVTNLYPVTEGTILVYNETSGEWEVIGGSTGSGLGGRFCSARRKQEDSFI